jgi:hypothetical protein
VHFVLNEKGISSALEAVNAIHKATHNLVTYECSISHGLRNFLSNSPTSATPGRTSPDSGSSRGVRNGQEHRRNHSASSFANPGRISPDFGSSRGVRNGQEHRRNHSGSSFGSAMMAKSPRGLFTGAGMASSFPPSINIPGQELFQSSVSPSSAGAPQPTLPEILRHDSSKYFPMMEDHHQQQAPRPLSSSLSSGNMGLTMSSDSSSTVGTPMGAAPRGFDFDLQQHGTTVFTAQYNPHYYHQARRGYHNNTNNSGFAPPSSSGEQTLNMNTSSQYSLWK